MKDIEDDIFHQEILFTEEVVIPSEAIGRIIGKKGANIMSLKQMRGIRSVALIHNSANSKKMIIIGETEDAISQVISIANECITRGQHHLANTSRSLHSWEPSLSGRILTPREVHKLGKHAPKIGTAAYFREKERLTFAKERHERDSESFSREINQKKGKLSSKQIKKQNEAFLLGLEQFEVVKAAREANKK